jgi:hypothetical protein
MYFWYVMLSGLGHFFGFGFSFPKPAFELLTLSLVESPLAVSPPWSLDQA